MNRPYYNNFDLNKKCFWLYKHIQSTALGIHIGKNRMEFVFFCTFTYRLYIIWKIYWKRDYIMKLSFGFYIVENCFTATSCKSRIPFALILFPFLFVFFYLQNNIHFFPRLHSKKELNMRSLSLWRELFKRLRKTITFEISESVFEKWHAIFPA